MLSVSLETLLHNMKKNLTDSTYSTHELDSQLLYSLRDFVLH